MLADAYGELISSSDERAAIRALREHATAILVADVSDPSADGLGLMRRLLAMRQTVMVVAVANPQDNEALLQATKLGAYQCLKRPLLRQSLRGAIDDAVAELCLRGATIHSYRRLAFAGPGKRLIGNSRSMRDVLRRINLVRRVDCNVIIRGETGTGKELVAQAIHNNSSRANEPFVKLNCGAIPKDLLESELFGHEKGAFTGALQQRIGRFEMAHKGTILLDEIGDMPLDLQVKLLSVIQDRAVQRVGGHEQIPVDVRIIAATHQNLEQAIEDSTFREDLYYRLKVVTIRVPTLRERREDIPLLALHFLKLYRHITHRAVNWIGEDAMQTIKEYDYPGNVRELENLIQSATVFCHSDTIHKENLPRPIRTITGPPAKEIRVAAGTPLEEVERLCIIETLRYTEGNRRRAAALLGISERSVYKKLAYYNTPPDATQVDNETTSPLAPTSEQFERA